MDDIKELTKTLAGYREMAKPILEIHEKTQSILIENMLDFQNEILIRLDRMERRLDQFKKQMLVRGMPSMNEYEISLAETRTLLESEEWPAAVEEELIARTTEEKMLRAELALRLMGLKKGDRYLDVGCGAGFFSKQAIEIGATVGVGLDIRKTWEFENTDNCVFTTDIDTVANLGPYNIISIYDVIDHLEQQDIVQSLKDLMSLLAVDGSIHVRVHPWTSRTAGHLYEKKNKAYLHLVMDDEELIRSYGFAKPFPLMGTVNPFVVYDQWFRDAGYQVTDKSIRRQKIEDFFKVNAIVREKLKGINTEWLEVQFIDYTLKPITEETNPDLI